MADDKNKQLFLSLIYSFQMQGMMQLGKLTNPMTSKTEKELDAAQVTIDMLDMLKEKTKNNTGDDESRFLSQVIADLKLNFVEEREKENKAPEEKDSGSPDQEKAEKTNEDNQDEGNNITNDETKK